MANCHVFWTADRIEQARDASAKHGGSRGAATVLSDRWGVRITSGALRAALAAAKFDPPGPAAAPVTAPPPPQQPDPDLLAFQRYKPVLPPVRGSRIANAKPTELLREVVIPDAHVPHHDRLAWACALGVVREWKPHRVTIIGDFLDLTSLSRHPKARPDLTRLSAELYAGNLALDELQKAAPGAEWVYVEGNHERRAIRYANELGTLDGLLTVPEQLFLVDRADGYARRGTQLRGMTWVPYEKQPYLTPWAAYYHGHNCTAQHHAAWHAATYCPSRTGGRPLFYGHMHTLQSARAASGGEAHCVGFLGDARAPELAYPEGRPTPWCHGLVLLEVDRATQVVTPTPVRIVHGRAVFHGRAVAAEAT